MCPPVVSVGGDGAMYDIGFQNLSRAMASGMPIKVLVLDTQVYSNTGGQACTSGFISQVADMTPYGPAMKGKEEIRKEIALIGMATATPTCTRVRSTTSPTCWKATSTASTAAARAVQRLRGLPTRARGAR